jgi:hypothetical protein
MDIALLELVLAIVTIAGVAVFLKLPKRRWRWIGFALFGIGLLGLLLLPAILRNPVSG